MFSLLEVELKRKVDFLLYCRRWVATYLCLSTKGKPIYFFFNLFVFCTLIAIAVVFRCIHVLFVYCIYVDSLFQSLP